MIHCPRQTALSLRPHYHQPRPHRKWPAPNRWGLPQVSEQLIWKINKVIMKQTREVTTDRAQRRHLRHEQGPGGGGIKHTDNARSAIVKHFWFHTISSVRSKGNERSGVLGLVRCRVLLGAWSLRRFLHPERISQRDLEVNTTSIRVRENGELAMTWRQEKLDGG